MKRLAFTFTLIVAMMTTIPSFAVSKKDMDHARAIAAQAYLRYANDGSGYLDSFKATGMADLEKRLKPKEKENLKAFKNVPVPQDYSSWDKQKLVDYWSTTAFSYKGLSEKGKIGKARARKNLNAMSVDAPEKKTEEQSVNTPQDAAAAQPASGQPLAPAEASQTSVNQESADTVVPLTEAVETDPFADPANPDADEETLPKASDNTWIYVVILCLLVGVVVALVVFASNIMKKNQMSRSVGEEDAGRRSSLSHGEGEAAIAEKDEEIKTLSKKLEAMISQNTGLKSKLEALTAEIALLRTRLSEADEKISRQACRPKETVGAVKQSAVGSPVAPQQKAAPQSSGAGVPVRTIYLGRANSKGIFVRADRTLNPGHSVFRLDTTDGLAGSFRVASNSTVWQMGLANPLEYLSGACTSAESPSEGMTKIVNDSAGTAIFEGGCWKVIRKARIHFE